VKSSLANSILFLSLAVTQVHAVTVIGLNTKPDRCPALAPMTADLNAAPFPADWTVYVACDVGTWKRIKQRVDGMNTDAAVTDRQHKITITVQPSIEFAHFAMG
jgi:hypothetical protein